MGGTSLLRVEAFVDFEQACEAACQKASDDEKRCAEADLESDERMAQAHAAEAFGDGSIAGVERFAWIGEREPPGGEGAAEEGCQHRQAQREAEDVGIEANFVEAREIDRRGGNEELQCPLRKEGTEDSAGK